MAEIEEECTFTVKCDDVKFLTRTNSDTITIIGIELDQGKAASMAWLVNHSGNLEFTVKPE